DKTRRGTSLYQHHPRRCHPTRRAYAQGVNPRRSARFAQNDHKNLLSNNCETGAPKVGSPPCRSQ
ncbi:MAG: hypothetical protein ACKVU2_02400, partial [Saprospiraceae bacterium]